MEVLLSYACYVLYKSERKVYGYLQFLLFLASNTIDNGLHIDRVQPLSDLVQALFRPLKYLSFRGDCWIFSQKALSPLSVAIRKQASNQNGLEAANYGLIQLVFDCQRNVVNDALKTQSLQSWIVRTSYSPYMPPESSHVLPPSLQTHRTTPRANPRATPALMAHVLPPWYRSPGRPHDAFPECPRRPHDALPECPGTEFYNGGTIYRAPYQGNVYSV